MKDSTFVHVRWSSRRVPAAKKNIGRVPVEFPKFISGILFKSI